MIIGEHARIADHKRSEKRYVFMLTSERQIFHFHSYSEKLIIIARRVVEIAH